MHDLSRLFRSRSVALVGASDKNPWSTLVARAWQAIGFDGPTHLVNLRGTPALGQQTVRSCTELDGVDAAFVCVPAAALLEAIEDMAAGGVRAGVVVTSGFAEVGAQGASEQARVFGRAKELGLTLLGPNSLGFSNFIDRVSLSAIPIRTPLLDRPRVGLVSQSGATAAMLYSFAHQQGVSCSYSIAMGNEAMVDLADVIQFLVDDEATRAVGVFAETIRKPERFADAARAAARACKPIVILKIGAAELTSTVAQAHTGALVGDDRVFQAICDAYNIVRVSSLEDLVITADLLAAVGRVDAGKGFSLISISGGACEICSDRSDELGVDLPQFAPATLEKLSSVIADFGAAHNPFDITGAAMRDPTMYSRAIEAIGADPRIGLIGVIGEFPETAAAASPMFAGYVREIGAGFAAINVPAIVIQQTLKPLSMFGRETAAQHGLHAVTGGLDHAMRAIAQLYRWSVGALRELPPQRVAPIRSSGAKPTDERATLSYLSTYGVPVIPQRVVTSAEDAVAAAAEIGDAVVLKVLSADIPHKTEVGGVLLDLRGAEAVARGFEQIMVKARAAKPSARIEGVLVSPMRRGGIELIVGVVRDPVWGLAMAVGLGGIWVELLRDSVLSVLPVSPATARDMVRKLKAAKLMEGYRGSAVADLDALGAVIAAIGDAALALGDELAALEINPLRVDGAHIEALDALAVWRS